MARQPARTPVERRNFWIGIGLGMIPVVVLWVAVGLASTINSSGHASPNSVAGPIGIAGGILYGASVLMAIVCLTMARSRRLGHGLLTMVFVGPVVWSVGCTVILHHH